MAGARPALTLDLIFMVVPFGERGARLRALAREDGDPRHDFGFDLHGMFDPLTGRSGRRRTGAARRGPWT